VALQRLGGFGGVADTLNAYNQYVGDPGFLSKDIAQFQNATVASVKSVAERDFVKTQRVTVYSVPGRKVLNDVPRSPDSTDADVKVVNPYSEAFETEQNWRTAPPAPGPTPKLHLPVPTILTLDNGLKVYVTQDHSLPVFTASVLVFAGADGNPANRPGLASYTARMLRQGTTRRSATQIAKDSGDIGATVATAANEDEASASIGGLSTNVAPALDLLSDIVEHPSFKQEEVERIRSERLTAIIQEADSPFATILRVGERIVYGDNAYAYPPSGTTESVKAVTAKDLTDFWAAHYGPHNATLVLAGDLTEAQARQLAEQYFGSWTNARASAPTVPATPENINRRVVIVDKPGAPQTALFVFGLGIARNTPDYAASNVMNDILGGLFSSRINMNLRERNGYTYGGFSFFNEHRGVGPLVSGAQVRTDVTAPAAQELMKELHGITTGPPTETEIQLAKNFSLQSLSGRFETNRSTSMLMGDLFIYDLPADYYRSLPAQFDSLTPAEITAAAQAHVNSDHMVLVAVGDRAKIQPGLEKLGLGPIELRDAQGNLVTK
jgi:zinc protease